MSAEPFALDKSPLGSRGSHELRSVLMAQSSVLLFDHPIRSGQHVGRNRQTDLLGGLQIDYQLELG
jgi:hypothetical protein